MQLAFGLEFKDLYDSNGLKKLDEAFLNFLYKTTNASLAELIRAFRSNAYKPSDKAYSELLLEAAPLVDDFLAELFGLEKEIQEARFRAKDFDVIYESRRKFVQRFASNKYSSEEIGNFDVAQLEALLAKALNAEITQANFAKKTIEWLLDESKYKEELELAAKYAAYVIHAGSLDPLFCLPQKIDQNNLISQARIDRLRTTCQVGFDYRSAENNSLDKALANANYCIYCHKQEKDSCSKGLKTREIEKPGCPLKQKISEMNSVFAKGFNLAALAIIVIDNPIVAATGHRICNDCSSSCIYQKQDPVDIPFVESEILNSVLKLPYGLEVYLLLTRWNPLNIMDPLPKPDTGHNVLVAGLGPAGIALSHYLLNSGHNVVAIDGLKISPLNHDFTLPIKCWDNYKEMLSKRLPQGFGGVAEYGITPRWDKNNLTILRIMLERRKNFKLYDGVRLGSNLTVEQAFALGFEHIALCIGAGPPKLIKPSAVENSLSKGVLSASDFLMSLQSGGAFLKDGTTNLVIRMPIIVIGCGLTAIDSAIEALNYYPVQVEKFLSKYEALVKLNGQAFVESDWTEEERIISKEFIEHATLFRNASSDKELREILQSLGGVSIYYRGMLSASPAYKLNHHEIEHAIADGINFIEQMAPYKVNVDEYGYVKAVEFNSSNRVLAKTVIIAIGTERDNFSNVLSKQEKANRAQDITYFGDCNESYSGSVVKALASSKYGYHTINSKLRNKKSSIHRQDLFRELDQLLISTVREVKLLSSDIVELIVHSPSATNNFKPGQFFRLQNYSNDVTKLIEPIALTGASVDKENGLISLIILEVGLSTRLCRDLIPGEKVVLMGPTGAPTYIPNNKKLMLIGGGLGNAVLFSIGIAAREAGCDVTYVAGYKKLGDRFYPEKIEEGADQVIWCCEEAELLKNRRQDISIQGNVVDGIKAHKGHIEYVICIGSSSMMASVNSLKKDLFPEASSVVFSINSPMQCMMKGICGQCVQKVNDDHEYIFACACQDQEGKVIDFNNLRDRLSRNVVAEKLLSNLGFCK